MIFKKPMTPLTKEYLEKAAFTAARCADLNCLKELKKMGVAVGSITQENGSNLLITFLRSTSIENKETRLKVFKFILKQTKDLNALYFDRHTRAQHALYTALDIAESRQLYVYGLTIKKLGGKSYKELAGQHPETRSETMSKAKKPKAAA